jgi:hypothetical protein
MECNIDRSSTELQTTNVYQNITERWLAEKVPVVSPQMIWQYGIHLVTAEVPHLLARDYDR